MCAIIDANVTFEVFGKKQTEAGVAFRRWLDGSRGRLVVGGKNLEELEHNGNFKRWFLEARRLQDKVLQVKKQPIREREANLVEGGLLKSDDEHILALVLVSGVRFLYTNDGDLKKDFGNSKIIPKPKGRIYTTPRSKKFTAEHKELLETKNLCSGSRRE